ncbi:MAG: hypothetical protein V3U84_02735 [Thiotrichaceae bacterium]
MSIAPKQFRKLVREVLQLFADQSGSKSFYSENAVELLMLTAAQETLLGKYLWQVKGPALGIFQMEPNTYTDIWMNFLTGRTKILLALNDWIPSAGSYELRMKSNLAYQIIMARIFYLRVPALLPPANDIPAMAAYYKKYWNTHLGAATVSDAIHNYMKYGT